MMRGSLKGVRARVERLARQVVRDGCKACREDEARLWVTFDTGFEADKPTEEPPVQTCAVCGRTYTQTHLAVSWVKPESASTPASKPSSGA